ncbi:MAG: hypothetical protein DWP97_02945 [Calditrichaeota bacterium]|nr:MAG: hypothetical protein DWP97_02945 [Calditrichota bacterium]
MSEERKKILEMLASGKITADEADRLLTVFDKNKTEQTIHPDSETINSSSKPKYLYVKIKGGCHNDRENVDVKIPLALLKAGIKISSLMPDRVKGKIYTNLSDQGLDFNLNELDGKKLDEIIVALRNNPVDIDSDKESIKIYCA